MGTQWPSIKARRLKAALKRIGWTEKRRLPGSHVTLARQGWPDYVFSFHDGAEVGSSMVAQVAKDTGLKPSDL
jgi:predicted RNA binding protein YcfA (HicA-like mRNA interferase family)